MDKKYKKFYMMFDKRFKNLILCSNLNCDGRVERNGALKRKYYGRFGSNGFCFRRNRGRSISSTRKTYKNPEEKGNSRRGLQGRLKHQTNLLNHGGVVLFAELYE